MTTESPSTNINIMEARVVSPDMLLCGIQYVLADEKILDEQFSPLAVWRNIDAFRQLRVTRSTKKNELEIGVRVSGDTYTDYGATAIFKYFPESCFHGFRINSEGEDYTITDNKIIVYDYVFHEYAEPIDVDFTNARDKEELDFYVQIMNLPIDERKKSFIMHKEMFNLNNFPVLKELLIQLRNQFHTTVKEILQK